MRPTDAFARPDDWGVTTVGKSIEIRRGASWSKEQEHTNNRAGSVPVLRIGNVQDRLETKDLLYLSGVPERVQALKRASKDWTILVGSNGNRNRIANAVFISEDTEYLFASFLIAAKPKLDSHILPAYFHRWLTTYDVQARLSASAEGTTGLSNMSHSFFRAMEIPTPPRKEQEAIVRILDAVDSAIDHVRTSINAAKIVKRGLLQKVFTKGIDGAPTEKKEVGEVPTSWKVVPLEQVAPDCQYGLSMPMHSKGEYPILRMAAIQDGNVLLDGLKYVDLSKVVADKYLITRGDILFNRTNSLELVGKVGVYRSDMPAVFASYLIRVMTDPTKVDNYFLGQMLASYAAQCRIRRYATPGVQQVNINATNLKRVLIALPLGESGLSEQRRIAAVLERQDNVTRKLEELMPAYQELKSGLMQDLLNGKVRVGQISDEAIADRIAVPSEVPA